MVEPDIIYEDKDIIVCYKPAGIAVQTKRLGQQDLESILKNYRAGKKEEPYIGLVHRLDQPVEGIMVFAKTKEAAAKLSAQVQKREIGKYYYAIGCKKTGQGAEPALRQPDKTENPGVPVKGTLTDYLCFDQRKNLGFVSTVSDKNAKKSVLDYEILKYDEEKGNALFKITLHTGRHHQIRLQLAHLGYPLLGDTKYGGPAAAGLALCSYRLEFSHPKTGKKMQFTIEPKNSAFTLYPNKENS